mmetsp:Transcript_40649/g.91286  ORF Transcript_40649/g.91286 Transcript_40649/m.91286 type:complete len:242 (-) Transcript_40649:37-762(-)
MDSIVTAEQIGLSLYLATCAQLEPTDRTQLEPLAVPTTRAEGALTSSSASTRSLPPHWPQTWPLPSNEENGHGSHDVAARIAVKLNASGVAYEHLGPHEPCSSSTDSLHVRQACGWTDTTLKSGAKAMLLVSKDQGPALIALPGDKKFSWRKTKSVLPGSRKSEWRLASEEEVERITGGCVPGSVPPFGSVFSEIAPTYADIALGDRGFINFNCGLRTRSMRMSIADYIAAEQPITGEFAE